MIDSVEELTEIMIRAPIQMAKSERESLVPIVGAGISLPLGLPSWQQLIMNLSRQAGFELGDIQDKEPPDLLEEIRHRMGETAFIASGSLGETIAISDPIWYTGR